MKYSLIALLTFSVLFLACSADEPQQQLDADLTLEQQVDRLIEQDEYQAALNLLEDEDRTDPEVLQLLEKTHLNYGLNSMSTFDPDQMRTRMNNALVQFAEVLRINPDNRVAREQIDQIMSIYEMMPDRSPDEEVLEELRDVGFNY